MNTVDRQPSLHLRPPQPVSVALEYMSAALLPLQRFWNAVIYVATSWEVCRMVVDWVASLGRIEATELSDVRQRELARPGGFGSQAGESMVQLAKRCRLRGEEIQKLEGVMAIDCRGRQ